MSGSSGNVYVILIGINEYGIAGCNDLHGSLENVRLLKDFLSSEAAITNLTVLTSPVDPTLGSKDVPDKNNVVKAFETTINKATINDSIYIHFSGHGAQVQTLWPHLKPDQMDEALVLMPVNGQADCLRDIEVACYLKSMADTGASVTVLLDCCHSGSTTRSGNIAGQENLRPQMTSVKLDPKSILQRNPLIPAEATQDFWQPQAESQTRSGKLLTHWLTQTKGVEFFASCREYEVGWQIYMGNSYVGVFTHCMVEAAKRHHSRLKQMSCDMIFKATRAEIDRLPPGSLNGTTKQHFVFGGGRLRLFLGTSSTPPTDIRVTRVYEPEPGKTHAEFDAGTLQGIIKGKRLALYEQGTTMSNILDFGEPLAVCHLVDVDDWTSNGLLYQTNGISLYHDQSLAAGKQPVKQDCKAVQISTILKDILQTPRTAMVGPKDNVSPQPVSIERIKIELRNTQPLIQLSESNPFFHIKVLNKDSAEISFVPNPKDTAKSVVIKVQWNELQRYLSHIVMFLNIADFGLAASSQQIPLEVEKCGILRGQSPPPDSHITAILEDQNQQLITRFAKDEDPQEVKDRDWLFLRVRNNITDTIYLEALYIEPSGCVTRIWPEQDNPPVELHPGASAKFVVQVQKVNQIAHNIKGVDFDTISVLATRSEQCHFPEKILPEVQNSKGGLDPDHLVNESKLPTRGVSSGLSLAGGLVRQINIRVV